MMFKSTIIALFVLLSPCVFADDNDDFILETQINLYFNLNLVYSSCSIGGDSDLNVNLGSWAAKDLAYPNSATKLVPFKLHLANCYADYVKITFIGDTTTDNQYLVLKGDSAASNVAIQLWEVDETNPGVQIPLKVGEESTSKHISETNDRWETFYANYISDLGGVTPGDANATAMIKIDYY